MKDPCDLCKSKVAQQTGIQIRCDACNICYHLRCLGLDITSVETFEKYHCPNCEPTAGPSTHAKTSLSALRWREILQERTFEEHDFLTVKGKDATLENLRSTGFRRPLLIKLDGDGSTKGLDMSMPPPSFTVNDVVKAVGEDHTVGVIDVATQSEAEEWTLRRWAEYFNTEPKDRIRNVISLEVSDTKLAKGIKVPRVVRELDWTRNFWPEDRRHLQPKVLLYCLMSVKNCYTDFHIDFGGSSVFYHVVSGSKIFYVAEPTPKNLEIYTNWCNNHDQSRPFLGDLFPKKCFKVVIKQGDTLLIPSGWIHSVFTPEASIVFGGNFVHSLHVPMQYRITRVERDTNTPLKYRYPSFERLNWFVVLSVYKQEKKGKVRLSLLSTIELHGLIELCKYVYSRQVLALPFAETLLSPTSTVSDETVLVEDYTALEIREILNSMPSEVSYIFIGWVDLLKRLYEKLCQALDSKGEPIKEKHRLHIDDNIIPRTSGKSAQLNSKNGQQFSSTSPAKPHIAKCLPTSSVRSVRPLPQAKLLITKRRSSGTNWSREQARTQSGGPRTKLRSSSSAVHTESRMNGQEVLASRLRTSRPFSTPEPTTKRAKMEPTILAKEVTRSQPTRKVRLQIEIGGSSTCRNISQTRNKRIALDGNDDVVNALRISEKLFARKSRSQAPATKSGAAPTRRSTRLGVPDDC